MYLLGLGEMQGVFQRARYIVHVGCAELNLMMCFLMRIEESKLLPDSNYMKRYKQTWQIYCCYS